MATPVRLAATLLVALAATGCLGDDAGSMDDTAPVAADAADTQLEPPMPVEPVPRVPGQGEPVEQCDAEAARDVVGEVATEAVVERARQAAGAELARTLKPGQMVTMEYHFSRLNIDVDEDNVITGVRCG